MTSSTTNEYSFFTCIEMSVFNTTGLNSPTVFTPINDSGNQPIGGASGFADDIKILSLYNGSAISVQISFDGVTPHLIMPAGGTLIVDLQAAHMSNSAYGSGMKYGRKGQLVWAAADPTMTDSFLYVMGYR